LQEQTLDGEESNSSSDIGVISGVSYRRDLLKQATIEDVSDKECFGFPAGVRHMDFIAPIMFKLTLGEINGKQRIVWAEVFTPDC